MNSTSSYANIRCQPNTNNLYHLTTNPEDPLYKRILRTIMYIFIHIITLGILFIVHYCRKHYNLPTISIYPYSKLFPDYKPIVDLSDPKLDRNIINNLDPSSLDALAILSQKNLAPANSYQTFFNDISKTTDPNPNFLNSYPISVQTIDVMHDIISNEPSTASPLHQGWFNNKLFLDLLNNNYYCITTSNNDDNSFYRAYSIGWLTALFRSGNPNAFKKARSHILSMPFYTHDQHASDQMADLLKICASYTHIQQLFDLCFLDPHHISKAINYFKALAEWTLMNNPSLFSQNTTVIPSIINKLMKPKPVIKTLKISSLFPENSTLSLDVSINFKKHIPQNNPFKMLFLILSTIKPICTQTNSNNTTWRKNMLSNSLKYVQLHLDQAMTKGNMSFNHTVIQSMIQQLPAPWKGLFEEFKSYLKPFNISPTVALLCFLLSYPSYENLAQSNPQYSLFIKETKHILYHVLPKTGSLCYIISSTHQPQEEQKLLEELWQSQMSLCILDALVIEKDPYDNHPLPGTIRIWEWYLQSINASINNHPALFQHISNTILNHINLLPARMHEFSSYQQNFKNQLTKMGFLHPQDLSQTAMLYLFLKKYYKRDFENSIQKECNTLLDFINRDLTDAVTSLSSTHHDIFVYALAYVIHLPISDVETSIELSPDHMFLFSHFLQHIFMCPEIAPSNLIFQQYIQVISTMMRDHLPAIEQQAEIFLIQIENDPWKKSIFDEMICHHKKLINMTNQNPNYDYIDELSVDHLVYLFSIYYLNKEAPPAIEDPGEFRTLISNYKNAFVRGLEAISDELLSQQRGPNGETVVSGLANKLLDILSDYDEEQQYRINLLLKRKSGSLSIFHQTFLNYVQNLEPHILRSLGLNLLAEEQQAANENICPREQTLINALSHTFAIPAITQLPHQQNLSSTDLSNFNSRGLGNENNSSIFLMVHNNHYTCLLPRIPSENDPLNFN